MPSARSVALLSPPTPLLGFHGIVGDKEQDKPDHKSNGPGQNSNTRREQPGNPAAVAQGGRADQEQKRPAEAKKPRTHAKKQMQKH